MFLELHSTKIDSALGGTLFLGLFLIADQSHLGLVMVQNQGHKMQWDIFIQNR